MGKEERGPGWLTIQPAGHLFDFSAHICAKCGMTWTKCVGARGEDGTVRPERLAVRPARTRRLLAIQDGVQTHLLGQAPQRIEPAVLEAQPRSRDEIAHRARH